METARFLELFINSTHKHYEKKLHSNRLNRLEMVPNHARSKVLAKSLWGADKEQTWHRTKKNMTFLNPPLQSPGRKAPKHA